MSSYSEKLKDPRWQKKRLEILERDRWQCQCCANEKETLHVHHMYYSANDPWNERDVCLITVCQTCHDKVHGDDTLVAMGTFVKLFFIIWLKKEVGNNG